MKTIFDSDVREGLITRITLLNKNSNSIWGQMNVIQMLMHCIKWEEMALGKKKHEQTFLGKLFGKMALKDFIKDETPFKKNVPTVLEFKIKEKTGDIELQKSKWVNLIREYEHFNNQDIIHPFFGKMTPEQLGLLAFKHTDHHLRQFGV
jgi:hypothetical protein